MKFNVFKKTSKKTIKLRGIKHFVTAEIKGKCINYFNGNTNEKCLTKKSQIYKKENPVEINTSNIYILVKMNLKGLVKKQNYAPISDEPL